MNVRGLIKASSIVNNVVIRNYALKSDLKIKWVRPEKIPCIKPEKSGDLSPMPALDMNRYQLEFRDCKELENADEQVKKLFTLQFAPNWKKRQVYINDMVDMVRRHPLDKASMEARIARWTGAIRALQEIIEKHPLNRKLKVKLKELIDKRKKHLKYLRRWDYKRFEWLIEHMNIVYKPPPTEFKWVTRKDSLRKLTQKYEDDIREERLNSYKLQLQEEQPSFLKEKIEALEFIRDEQKECGVEVTVSQDDIDAVKKQLEEMLLQKEQQNTDSK